MTADKAREITLEVVNRRKAERDKAAEDYYNKIDVSDLLERIKEAAYHGSDFIELYKPSEKDPFINEYYERIIALKEVYGYDIVSSNFTQKIKIKW